MEEARGCLRRDRGSFSNPRLRFGSKTDTILQHQDCIRTWTNPAPAHLHTQKFSPVAFVNINTHRQHFLYHSDRHPAISDGAERVRKDG